MAGIKTKIIPLVILVLFFFPLFASTSSLYGAYDLIYTSHPASSTNHNLNFTTGQAVPSSGKIIIVFEPAGITIPAGFEYLDMDFAVANVGKYFIDREISNATSSSDDKITVTTGTSGAITIDLNTSTGIDANKKVRLEMGTNATYAAAGVDQLVNAPTTGEYWIDIKTYDAANVLLDRVRTFIVMISPVAVSASSANKIRSNGSPDGVLAAGTTQTTMSLTTNYQAECRYSNVASTSYYDMTDEFNDISGGIFHTVLLTGLVNDTSYIYYVRCFDPSDSTVNTDDYIIDFSIAEEEAGPGPSDGGPGGGIPEEEVEVASCLRSDLNKDGEVNLVDFSILMYFWGSDDPDADINQDGEIDLIDFSIMMYCWTD